MASIAFEVIDGQSLETINTVNGDVTGQRLQYASGDVNRFRGIPYAKPPIGPLRFKSPQEPESWSGNKQTIKYSDQCSQMNNGTVSGSEDCLYLNIFTPSVGTNMAVMVWIHGGSLLMGSASDYPGETLALYGDVVVVTINYRLGIMGFFTDGTSDFPGNAGIADQVEYDNCVHQQSQVAYV